MLCMGVMVKKMLFNSAGRSKKKDAADTRRMLPIEEGCCRQKSRQRSHLFDRVSKAGMEIITKAHDGRPMLPAW